MLLIIYAALSYWAVGVVYENTVFISSKFGGVFMKKLCIGLILGFIFIPMAVFKRIFKH